MKQPTIVYEWEEYTNGPNEPTRDKIYVTLNQRGMLLLNRKAFEAIGEPFLIMLLYDRKHQAIGIRMAGAADQKPFPVKPHPRGSHRYIHARPFCRHHGILPNEVVRFTDPELHERDRLLILSLHRTEPVVPKKRRAKLSNR